MLTLSDEEVWALHHYLKGGSTCARRATLLRKITQAIADHETREAQPHPVDQWLAKCCDTSSSELWASNADLWRSWRDYAEANGHGDYCRTATSLGKMLERKYKSKLRWMEGTAVRGRTSIALKAMNF